MERAESDGVTKYTARLRSRTNEEKMAKSNLEATIDQVLSQGLIVHEVAGHKFTWKKYRTAVLPGNRRIVS